MTGQIVSKVVRMVVSDGWNYWKSSAAYKIEREELSDSISTVMMASQLEFRSSG